MPPTHVLESERDDIVTWKLQFPLVYAEPLHSENAA